MQHLPVRRGGGWTRGIGMLILCVLGTPPSPVFGEETRRTDNVILVTIDGFRWQDFFGGADETLIDKSFGGVKDIAALKAAFWREDAAERRKRVLPFLWETVAEKGQIFGDPSRKAATKITNGHKFSYPGYSEILCGFADERIDSNAKKDNPNPSVLEFLNDRPAFKNKVAAFGSWDVFPYILRARRNGLKMHAGWNPVSDEPLSEGQKTINETLTRLPRLWPDCTFDAPLIQAAQEHLRRHKPRVMFIGLGETDEWGHGRRYDLYLDAAKKSDRFLADLWKWLQETPEYRGTTTLIVTTDHGRGPTRADWTDHGKKIPTAEFIWIGILGPGVPARGVRENVETTQAQVAATIASLLGEDYRSFAPKAAAPLPLGQAP